jgi:hypothetical protein
MLLSLSKQSKQYWLGPDNKHEKSYNSSALFLGISKWKFFSTQPFICLNLRQLPLDVFGLLESDVLTVVGKLRKEPSRNAMTFPQ